MPLARLKGWARRLKSETYALYLACRDPRVPWYAKVFAAAVVGYAFSPVDLVPDFIPVVGYLDDLVLVPLGIWLAVKMIPEPVLKECRERAAREIGEKPRNWAVGVVVIGVWLLVVALIVYAIC